jgi:CheY-like chemotaxis protein/HPt (histidine-containing phosphotransfer) domain-containing protein
MIDHNRLAAIAQGSQRGRDQVLADFRRANASDASCLHLACAAHDFAQLTLLAHRMKGACLMIGAISLAEACSLLALAGRARSTTNAQEALAFYDRQSAELDAYLGALPANAPGVDQPDPQGRICAGLRFVVAEDHDFQRNLIMMLLRRAGAEAVCGVDDGAKALNEIKDAEHAVDILVLDLSMPGMDANELMRRLAKENSAVAVILNSALSPSLMSAIIKNTVTCNLRILGIVSKPLTAAALKPLIEAYRDGGKFSASAMV